MLIWRRVIVNRLLAVALSISLLLALPLAAQEESSEKPVWVQVMVVEVLPDMVEDFENVMLTHWYPAVKRSDVPWVATWRQAGLGKAFTYAFLSPMQTIGELDEDSPIRNAMKGEDYAAMMARLRRCITSLRVEVTLFNAAMSAPMADGVEPKLAVFNVVTVKPDKHREYQKLYADEVLPAMKRLDFPGIYTLVNVLGGDSNKLVHVVLIDNFAHIDKGAPLHRALGREKGDDLAHRLNAFITAEETNLASYLPELSKTAGQ
jgi:hypothetical protein